MEDLTNFGKSLQGSLTSGFTAVTVRGDFIRGFECWVLGFRIWDVMCLGLRV